jgi:hypothetical protein
MWTGAMSMNGKLNSIFGGSGFWHVKGYCESYISSSDRVISLRALLVSVFRDGGGLIFYCACPTNAGSSGLSRLSGLSG